MSEQIKTRRWECPIRAMATGGNALAIAQGATDCTTHDCAWWNENGKRCAILQIADALEQLACDPPVVRLER